MPETKELTQAYQEEEGLNVVELFSVMFGRKLLLGIVTGAITVVGSVGSWIYNRSGRTYDANFSFKEISLNGKEAKFYNGSSFNIADLVTLSKITEYKESVPELANIDLDKINEAGGVKYAGWYVTHKENEGEEADKNVTYVVDKENYKITVNASLFSDVETKALVKAVINEAWKLQEQSVKNANHKNNLEKYESSNILEDKLKFLQDQYKYVLKTYDDLQTKFGDVVAKDGVKLSELKNNVVKEFQNVSWTSLESEIKTKYLVSDVETSRDQIEADLEDLNLLLEYAKKERDELIAQRNALVAAGGDKYTLELGAYNTKIIELTEKITNYEMQIELLQKKLEKLNLSSGSEKTQYEQDLAKFNAKLESMKATLVADTQVIEAIEPVLYKTNEAVYFVTDEASSTEVILQVNNPIQLVLFCGLSLLGGLVIAMIVNLVLDGKKLTKKWKEEQAKAAK